MVVKFDVGQPMRLMRRAGKMRRDGEPQINADARGLKDEQCGGKPSLVSLNPHSSPLICGSISPICRRGLAAMRHFALYDVL
jgi:hypothetical protein